MERGFPVGLEPGRKRPKFTNEPLVADTVATDAEGELDPYCKSGMFIVFLSTCKMYIKELYIKEWYNCILVVFNKYSKCGRTLY